MYCQPPDTKDHSRTYVGTPIGIPLTVADRLVPCDCVYRFPSPSTVETHSQYWVTPVPLVQLNVTVDDGRTDPGAGATIRASATPLDALVDVGGGVGVGVGVFVAVGAIVGVPGLVAASVGEAVGVRDGVGVIVAVAASVGIAAGVEVVTSGPYG